MLSMFSKAARFLSNALTASLCADWISLKRDCFWTSSIKALFCLASLEFLAAILAERPLKTGMFKEKPIEGFLLWSNCEKKAPL